jgi:hypothetical protein
MILSVKKAKPELLLVLNLTFKIVYVLDRQQLSSAWRLGII